MESGRWTRSFTSLHHSINRRGSSLKKVEDPQSDRSKTGGHKSSFPDHFEEGTSHDNKIDFNDLITKARWFQVSPKELIQVQKILSNNLYLNEFLIQYLIDINYQKANIDEKIIEEIKKLTQNQKIDILVNNLELPNQTIKQFFEGKPVERGDLINLCLKLKTEWEKIVDIDFLITLVKVVPKVRSRCYPKIQDQCGTLKILDVSRPIELDELYVDINILENPISNIHLDISELPRVYNLKTDEFDRLALSRIEQERVPSRSVVNDYSKLMILGKPGSGKSTFLQHLAIECNRGELQPDRVPIFIQLRNLTKDIEETNNFNLLRYISQKFCSCGVTELSEIETLLRHGRALILLDGLDEISEQNSDKIVTEIRSFCESYQKNRFIITCRIAAQKFLFTNFTYVEIADFNDSQIKLFTQNWFTTVDKNGGKQKAKQLIEKLNHQESQQIKEIAITPILLILICLVFQARAQFPANRSDLYKEGLEILLKRWDETKGIKRDQVYRNLTLVRKKKLLSQAAIKFFEQNIYFFNQDDIQLLIWEYLRILPNAKTDEDELLEDSEAVLKSIEVQHGLLVERASKIYSFSHLAFQEYFVALNIVGSSDQNNVTKLISNITQRRWREIFLRADEILPNSDSLWQQVKQYVDAMIASESKLQDFLAWVNEKAHSARAIKLVINAYKENAVRAVYFAHHLSLNIDLAVILDPNLTPVQKLAFDFHRKLVLDHARDLSIAHQVERDVALDIVLYHALYHRGDLNLAIDRAIDRSLDIAINREAALKLNQCLNQLKDKLTHEGTYANNQAWTEELRTVMVSYRNIGKDWKFKENEKKLLKQYYDANNLLVDCLENASKVSPIMKQKIKDTLLLPINDTE